MIGKICLVTGGTNGIGKATAHALAQMGATVVIVGRDAQKAAQVSKEIQAASGNQNVDWLLADLSSQQDIRRLAEEFKSKYSQLHVLINNAGGTFMTRQLSVDGIEMTFALNHLAYFLLTNLLLDTIKASVPARIISVSSDAHSGGIIEFDNLQGERSYSGIGPYGNSKLANILFTTELARRLEGTGVTVNVLHPGLVSTGFGKNNPGLVMKIMGVVIPLIARSPERGAITSIYLVSSPAVQNITGQYFVDCKVTQPAPQAADSAVARELWDVSAEMVHLADAVPEMT
ncbi:MAG: SDR family oxidoreductase [Anaerolineales bacterium]|nr:SDR family oxidoreductase [Anaerolineales bacterium]